jgi:putative esterase
MPSREALTPRRSDTNARRSFRALVTVCLLLLPLMLRAAEFEVRLPEGKTAVDGRLLLLLATDDSQEPRFLVRGDYKSQQVFGVDVEGARPGTQVVFDTGGFGYPVRSIADLPAGKYWVQALLHKYETFHRADGHVVKLPMDRGEGQQWNRAPGNVYSKPKQVTVRPGDGQTVSIQLGQVIPPIKPPADTKYVKHIRMKSELLSKFWGRDMYLGAHILLPEGFDKHPKARYPLVINHGHFPADFSDWRTEPPDPDLKPDYSERFDVEGYNRIVQQEGYDFYKKWTGPDFPRMLIIEIQHANPYYDDSYAVNSENLGPYGDAITHELVPYIEKKFRGIGEGWARFLYGGSTGGWEALAAQILYPEDYNGAFGACPDPIDFRAYTTVNLYEDANAYFYEGPFERLPRPGKRDGLGHVTVSLQGMNYMELALGTKSRSGQQWDIWEAVYSPVGDDGYPQRIWDKVTGEIDQDVAAFWRENYDLVHILRRDWQTLGPKLQGKLHIYCGDMDNYYLNNAVYLAEEFLKQTTAPHYDGEVTYGDRAEHCWNGDPNLPNHLSRLRYNSMYVDKIIKRIEASAPAGADLKSWRY